MMSGVCLTYYLRFDLLVTGLSRWSGLHLTGDTVSLISSSFGWSTVRGSCACAWNHLCIIAGKGRNMPQLGSGWLPSEPGHG